MKTKTLLGVVLWICFLLSGCVSLGNEGNENISSGITPTGFSSPEITQVIATSTSMSTPQPTPYQTPLPLPEEEAAELILELYETNGGCELPCWWGIAPGETLLNTAMDLLLSIGKMYTPFTYRTEFVYDIGINIPQEIGDISFAVVYLRTPLDPSDPYYGIVTGVSVDDTFATPYNDYVLADYLGLLGEPDQVYLGISYTYVFIMLFYVEEGITIYNHQIRNELWEEFEFLACPQSEYADTWHWSARNPDTAVLEDMIAGARNGPYYIPMEEVTEITISEFYEIYLDPATNYCIEGEIDIETEN